MLELGCGLGLPSVVAARAGVPVLATDGASDAVAHAAHALALNELRADVAVVDWTGTARRSSRAGRGISCSPPTCSAPGRPSRPRCGCPAAARVGGELRIADPDRAGARATLHVWTRDGDVALHSLVPR